MEEEQWSKLEISGSNTYDLARDDSVRRDVVVAQNENAPLGLVSWPACISNLQISLINFFTGNVGRS